ncbi:Elongation factor 2 [Durusdinium trenchii]|uniref:Elongation factor 2 n=1 Tax=Durusdinium trenchii TaxID=1381693 RepID=A0ABP0SI40_9DINO
MLTKPWLHEEALQGRWSPACIQPLTAADQKKAVTDLEEEIEEALRQSIAMTRERSERSGAQLEARRLDWDDGLTEALDRLESTEPRLLLGAELLWADDAVDVLLEAVEESFIRRLQQAEGTSLTLHRCAVETRGSDGEAESHEDTTVLVWEKNNAECAW